MRTYVYRTSLSSGTKGACHIAYSSLSHMQGSCEMLYRIVFNSEQAHVLEAQLHLQDNKQATGLA